MGVEPDGRERLVFIAGDVPVPPFPEWSQTDAVLASTARLMRRFHDATVGFVAPAGTTWSNEMQDPHAGGEDDTVICHNDVCPENVVYRAGEAVALLDFDFAAPGRRVYDVACMARMCVPVEADEDSGAHRATRARSLHAPARGRGRVRPGCGDTPALLDVLAEQFEHGGAFVRRRVAAGEPAFIEMWNMMGGQERFDRRRDWFAANRSRFLDALT